MGGLPRTLPPVAARVYAALPAGAWQPARAIMERAGVRGSDGPLWTLFRHGLVEGRPGRTAREWRRKEPCMSETQPPTDTGVTDSGDAQPDPTPGAAPSVVAALDPAITVPERGRLTVTPPAPAPGWYQWRVRVVAPDSSYAIELPTALEYLSADPDGGDSGLDLLRGTVTTEWEWRGADRPRDDPAALAHENARLTRDNVTLLAQIQRVGEQLSAARQEIARLQAREGRRAVKGGA